MLYMHEEVKKNSYLVNFSASASSDAPITSMVTADDLIEDRSSFDDIHHPSRSFHTVTGFDSENT